MAMALAIGDEMICVYNVVTEPGDDRRVTALNECLQWKSFDKTIAEVDVNSHPLGDVAKRRSPSPATQCNTHDFSSRRRAKRLNFCRE